MKKFKLKLIQELELPVEPRDHFQFKTDFSTFYTMYSLVSRILIYKENAPRKHMQLFQRMLVASALAAQHTVALGQDARASPQGSTLHHSAPSFLSFPH